MMEWLLDLDALRFGQEGVEFGFARPMPAWAWALVIAGALVLAAFSYRRLEGRALWRGTLAFLRAALLIALAVLIAGPRLIKPNETEEKDWVLVLVDRSASLNIADVDRPGRGDRVTREQQLRRILEQNSQVWTDLSQGRIVQWLGFDASTYELDVQESPGAPGPVINPGQADGRRTAIGRALSEALRRVAARPVSAIVILSDGQSADEPDRATLRALTNGQIPVYSIPLGSEGAATDYAVRIADAPRVAFTNDMVPVEVRVDRLGDNGIGDGADRVTAQLVDRQTGLLLAEEDVVFEEGQESATATLITQPKDAAAAEWSVRLVAEPADLISDNNTVEMEVELVDRPMRVVYFDGYSRWEYRYIKNLFVREDSIDSSVLLLAPNRKYLQEGDIPLDLLPTSPEEWAEFDVIMLGDLRPEMFTEEQLEQIREHVAIRGAGLVWIGGEGSTPHAWAGTPLADLLPFTVGEGTPPGRWGAPVTMRTTDAADRLGVLRLAEAPDENGSWWPQRLSDPTTGWSQLRYAQRIEPTAVKPTTEVLASAVPAAGESEGTPLVMSMRYGAGRILYVGTDEIWRWRYGRGEFYPERFWLQMVRLLGRERLARAGKSAILTVNPARGEVARPMRIGVELVDQLLLDAAPPNLRARVERIGEPGSRGRPTTEAGEVTELILQPERSDGGFGRGTEVRSFAATWLPHVSGRYQIEVADPLLAGGSLRAEADVWRPDDEMRQPQTDHAALASLGEATGGGVIEPADLLRPDLIPNRKVRIIGAPEVEDLWDTPLALIVVITLLTLEWVGRRLLRFA